MVKLIDQKEEDYTEYLKNNLKKLSNVRTKMIQMLFELLHNISKKHDENNMTPKNLAVVMGFNVLTVKGNDPLLLRDYTSKIIFVSEKMVDLYPKYL